MQIIGNKYGRKKYSHSKKGEKIIEVVLLPNGMKKVVKMRKYKSLPKGCSVARQLCLVCRKHIHKNDLNYDKKICKPCEKLSNNVGSAP